MNTHTHTCGLPGGLDIQICKSLPHLGRTDWEPLRRNIRSRRTLCYCGPEMLRQTLVDNQRKVFIASDADHSFRLLVKCVKLYVLLFFFKTTILVSFIPKFHFPITIKPYPCVTVSQKRLIPCSYLIMSVKYCQQVAEILEQQ